MTRVVKPQAGALVLALLAACAGDSKDAAAGSAEQPLLVEVPAGAVVEGLARGRLRNTSDVAGFSITKHPITQRQYRACLDAGACREPAQRGCDAEHDLADLKVDAAKSPAVCVGVKNAESFCRWMGGRLPRLAEWQYAARGLEPRLHAWGDHGADCERHPRAQRMTPPTGDDELVSVDLCAKIEEGGKLEVGKHEGGASPLGVEDVLITPAELLATEAKPLLSACSSAFAACAVTGRTPGAIEGVLPIRGQASKGAAGQGPDAPAVPRVPTYAFRCVVEEE